MRPSLTSLAIIVLMVNSSLAQQPPFEFGKISASDMDLADFQAKYPDEAAAVIGDIATCRFEVDSRTGYFNYLIDRTIRFIILSPEGLGYGDFPIPFYQTRNEKEEITSLRGNVYNLEGGKIQRERIRNRDGLVNDLGNNWKEMVIPIAGVKTGSVIELQYTLKSPYLHVLPNWKFQREIPVMHSEFKLRLPSLYIYRVRYRGGIQNLTVEQETPIIETMRIPKPKAGYGGSIGNDFFTVNVHGTEFLWVAKNLPALRPEPYTSNIRNYQAAMDFELITQQFPESPPRHYSNSWESVREFLFGNKDFGGFLNESADAMFHATGIKATDDFSKDMESAIHEIQKRIRWNNKNSLFAENTPDEVLQRGSGNSAEVNLMLCGLLRNMGYKAEAVVLSTVGNGDLLYDTPTISKLNYIIVAVERAPNEYLVLDATESLWPPGFLPSRLLNGKGKFLSAEATKWIDLESPRPMKTKKSYKLSLDAEGNLSGNLQYEYFGYSKFSVFKGIEENLPNNVVEALEKKFGVDKTQIAVTNKDLSEAPITISASIHLSNLAQFIGNEIILPSLLFETREEHPFSLEERKYPVHFIAPQSEEIIFEIQLPEGFRISHLPKEYRIRARGGFMYEYQPNFTDNTIMIRAFQEATQTQVEPGNYSHLRSFHDRIVRAHGEKILISIN